MSSEDSTTPYHKEVYQKFPKEIIQSHIPQYNVGPYSRGANTRPLSAVQITSFRNKSKCNTFFPKFFMNPYQDLDYMVLQHIYANSMEEITCFSNVKGCWIFKCQDKTTST